MNLMIGLLLVLAASAWAHEESMHKGKATHGTVTALSGETLTVQTDNGPLSVTLTKETKFERGEKDAGRDALVSGAHVAVFGTKVPGEGLVAKEVVIDEGGMKEHEGSHHEH